MDIIAGAFVLACLIFALLVLVAAIVTVGIRKRRDATAKAKDGEVAPTSSGGRGEER